MFTGIIQGKGKILSRRTAGGGFVFDLEADFAIDQPEEGESIAVSGVCLTAYHLKGRRFAADVSPETLARSTLGGLGAGSLVNLERALRLTDRLGGHLVSGHVDCVGSVTEISREGDFTILSFSVANNLDRYIIEKGSITIDGISLTVNSCSRGSFSVSIIPHTMQVTTLGALKRGGKVNIEVDIIGKYVEKLLSERAGGTSEQSSLGLGFLAEKGFL